MKIESVRNGVFQNKTVQSIDIELKYGQNILLNYSIDKACRSMLKYEFHKVHFIKPSKTEKNEDSAKDHNTFWNILLGSVRFLNKTARILGWAAGTIARTFKTIFGGK